MRIAPGGASRLRRIGGGALAAACAWAFGGGLLVATPACGGNDCRTNLEDIQAKLDACEVPLGDLNYRQPYDFEPLPQEDQDCKKKRKAVRDCEAACFRPADCAAVRTSPQHDPNNSAHQVLASELDTCLQAAELCTPTAET